jgi:hypothetical protein
VKNTVLFGLSLCALAFLLSGCATQDPTTVVSTGPGFFTGLWHGMVAPLAFIGHLFDESIAVFAVPNNGGWYTFGFLVGLGGLSSSPIVKIVIRKR